MMKPGWLKKSLLLATARESIRTKVQPAVEKALLEAYDLGYKQALKDNGLAPNHVCGLRGFNPMLGDECPACDKSAREREAERQREDDGA